MKIRQFIRKKIFIPFQTSLLYLFDFIFRLKKYTKKYLFVVGVDEIANNIYFFKNLFKGNALSVNFTENKFYKNNKYDYTIKINNWKFRYIARLIYGPYLLAKLSHQADVFVYFWWTGFCVDREIDYKFLKKKNKRIVCIFVGSDIRSLKLQKEIHQKQGLDHSVFYLKKDIEKEEKRVKKVAKDADKYADLIINPQKAQPSYLKRYVDTFIYMIKDDILNQKEFKLPNKDELIKILHAPSNPVSKGTQLVRAAIKKLEIKGYKFEYIELINKSNKEVLKLLENSHIVLNQFYAVLPGLFGIEAMAKKNAVLMSADYEILPTGGKKPWLRTKYWEVYDNLRYLLDNPAKIKEFAETGFEFVKENYTEEKAKKLYLDLFYKHKVLEKN